MKYRSAYRGLAPGWLIGQLFATPGISQARVKDVPRTGTDNFAARHIAHQVAQQPTYPAIASLSAIGKRLRLGQGWIRTSVRKTGQIYSLLPLTTRPLVHTSMQGNMHCIRAGPAMEAARWRNAPCLTMPQVGKGYYPNKFF